MLGLLFLGSGKLLIPLVTNTKIIAIAAASIPAVAGLRAGIALLTKDSGGEYTVDTELQVFGNANGDWKLDSNDVTYLREKTAV